MVFQNLVRYFAIFELHRPNNCLLRESNAEVSVVKVEWQLNYFLTHWLVYFTTIRSGVAKDSGTRDGISGVTLYTVPYSKLQKELF